MRRKLGSSAGNCWKKCWESYEFSISKPAKGSDSVRESKKVGSNLPEKKGWDQNGQQLLTNTNSKTGVERNEMSYTPQSLTARPWPMACWKTILSHWEDKFFRGELLNFGRVYHSITIQKLLYCHVSRQFYNSHTSHTCLRCWPIAVRSAPNQP